MRIGKPKRHLVPGKKIGQTPNIAMRGIHEREHERHQPFTPLDMNTIIKNCQAVRRAIGEILGGEFLVGQLLAESGNVTQPTRPDQGAAALSGLVVLLSEGTHFIVRIPLFGELRRKRR